MLKLLSSGIVMITLVGICSSVMTREEMLNPMSQICWLARSRNPNTNVRVNSSFGSSPSKPRPVAISSLAERTMVLI